VEGLGDIVDVHGVETGDGDTTVHSHIDGVVLAKLINLVLVQSSEREHANLTGDVAPIMLIAQLCELATETDSHLLHTARHVAQVLVPHGCQLGVAEDDVDDTSTVNGRVGVDGSGNLLDAAHGNVLLSLTSTNRGEAASALTVKTKVLGERLEEHDVVGVLLEQLQGVAVLLEVAGGESLVGAIEGGEKLLSLNNL